MENETLKLDKMNKSFPNNEKTIDGTHHIAYNAAINKNNEYSSNKETIAVGTGARWSTNPTIEDQHEMFQEKMYWRGGLSFAEDHDCDMCKCDECWKERQYWKSCFERVNYCGY